jgi:alpha,alpha-trehalase
MVEVLAEMEGDEIYKEFMPALLAEHEFWMDGKDEVGPNTIAKNHVVWMPNGALLNRYYDAGDRPRAESYREDVLAIQESGRDSQTVARHLRSGAESGWDYSARWFADGKNISTIITTDIVPPDLNSLLWKLEWIIATKHADMDQKNRFAATANARAVAMDKYLYDAEAGFYQDLNWTTGAFTDFLTLAGVYPLFVGFTDNRRAAAVGDVIAEKFLAPGGVRTSLVDTDQQWDAPNGWPPLQWMTYQGLKNYNENSVARQIRERWMENNERVYANVNKMVEKYNVEDITLEAGGGEYPVQDGFGWSNGVYLRLAAEE